MSDKRIEALVNAYMNRKMRRTAGKPGLLRVQKRSKVDFSLKTENLKFFLNAFKFHIRDTSVLKITRSKSGLTTTISMDLIDLPHGFEGDFFPVLDEIFNIVEG